MLRLCAGLFICGQMPVWPSTNVLLPMLMPMQAKFAFAVILLSVSSFFFVFLLLFLFGLWPLGESAEGLRSERSRGGYRELKVVDCSEAVGEGVVPQSRSEREKEVLAADIKTPFEKLKPSYSFAPGFVKSKGPYGFLHITQACSADVGFEPCPL